MQTKVKNFEISFKLLIISLSIYSLDVYQKSAKEFIAYRTVTGFVDITANSLSSKRKRSMLYLLMHMPKTIGICPLNKKT